MRLRRALRALLRWGSIVLLTTALTSAVAFAVSKAQTPTYRSTIYINVWPARLDLSLQQTIQALLRNFAGTIQSRETVLKVVTDLQLDVTPEQLMTKLIVEPVESDYLIRIEAEDYDPLIARAIAQRAADVFVKETTVQMLEEEQRDRVEVSILDVALPGRLHKPNWRLNTLAGALAGLVLGVCLVVLLRRWEAQTIRSSEDVETRIGITVLASVPVAHRDRAPFP